MTFEKIKSILNEQFNLDEDSIKLDTSFEDLNADSLDMADLLSNISDEYDIEFESGAIGEIKTVGDLVDYIEEHRKN